MAPAAASIEALEGRRLLSGGLNFANGFADTTGISLNALARLDGSKLELTGQNLNFFGGRAISNESQNVTQFNTEFTIQATFPPNPTGTLGGFGLVLTNADTLVFGGPGGGFGSGRTFVGISFDHHRGAANQTDTNLNSNLGSFGNGNRDLSAHGIDFSTGHVFDISLIYDGVTLHERVTDMSTQATFVDAYTVDIPAILGADASIVALMGFAAARW